MPSVSLMTWLKGVILDLQMPKKTGVQAAKAIWAENPAMPIIFWSNYADEAYVRGVARIVPAGATYGYLLKTASKDRLRRAIQCVFVEGQNIIDREVRGLQKRGQKGSDELTEVEYEILLDYRHWPHRPGDRRAPQHVDALGAGAASAALCQAGACIPSPDAGWARRLQRPLARRGDGPLQPDHQFQDDRDRRGRVPAGP